MIDLTINFFVSGFLKQNILVGTGETPARFMTKLRRGTYVATLAGPEIFKRGTGEVVGVVIAQHHRNDLSISKITRIAPAFATPVPKKRQARKKP